MRCIIRKLTLVAVAVLMMAVPARADESAVGKTLEEGQQAGKNECLLVAINCANQVDSIQQRIERIKGEIARGTEVYTNDELNKLGRKLDDAIKTLDEISLGG